MLALAVSYGAVAFAPAGAHVALPHAAAARATMPHMDETIMEKALAGELEQEGAENLFLSEVGWASFLDKECGSSYNMNQRVSAADDGYFTPDIFSNPLDVGASWFASMKRVASDPLAAGFMTISNDQDGKRSFPKGLAEVNARTIKPKVKNMDPKARIVGIPGYNLFGSPSSKQGEKGSWWDKIF